MGLGKYLGAFLLGAAAYLYSPVLQAEDKEARVEFLDKGTRGIPGIGKPDLEAVIKTSAWTEDNKVLISVKTENCSIEERSRIFIGLQIDADPINTIQKAYVKTTKGEKEVDLSSSSILKEVDNLIGKGVVKLADNIPFFSDGINLVQWLSGSEERKIEEKMRKENRLLLRELPLHTKFILNPVIGLSYEIPIDRTLTETPQTILKIYVKDGFGRTQTIPDFYLKCGKKSQMQQAQQLTKPNVPKNLETLFNDPDFKLTKLYGPKELSELFKIPVEGLLFAEQCHVITADAPEFDKLKIGQEKYSPFDYTTYVQLAVLTNPEWIPDMDDTNPNFRDVMSKLDEDPAGYLKPKEEILEGHHTKYIVKGENIVLSTQVSLSQKTGNMLIKIRDSNLYNGHIQKVVGDIRNDFIKKFTSICNKLNTIAGPKITKLQTGNPEAYFDGFTLSEEEWNRKYFLK